MIKHNNYLIFAKINIYNINIGKDKVDDLNQNFQNLVDIVEYESFNDTKDIEQLIINIKTILNMIIDESKSSSYFELISNERHGLNSQNSYFNSLKSALFFLNYLYKNIINEIDINKNIYSEYKKYIDNLILELMPSLNEEKVKIYEWLLLNKYINQNQNLNLYSEDELNEFYNNNHKKVIDFVINNDIYDLFPYYNIGAITAYKKLMRYNETNKA